MPVSAPTGRAICLIGMPGSGKSAVGRVLADRLDRPFVDLDDEVERRAGRSVAAIFERDGETAFRAMEVAALVDVVARGEVVVACGGGVVTTEDGRLVLADALPVLLEADLAEIEARVAAQPVVRPLLDGDVSTRLAELADRRRPWFRDLAVLTVRTDHRSVDEVAAEIVERLP